MKTHAISSADELVSDIARVYKIAEDIDPAFRG